jgi:uncharacterized protein YkwD
MAHFRASAPQTHVDERTPEREVTMRWRYAAVAAALSLFAKVESRAENRLIETICDGTTCRRVYVGSQWENDVISRVNTERRSRGLNPLKISKSLMESARRWSGRQAEQKRMYHSGWPGIGENVARGQKNPSEVMRAWLNSPGHRANILNPRYSEMGAGVVVASDGQPFWTQQFK